MLKSNQPAVPLSMYNGKSQLNNSLSSNTEILDNMKVREQVRSMQKARMTGNSQAVAKAARRKRLTSQATQAGIRPLVRKRNAREYGQ